MNGPMTDEGGGRGLPGGTAVAIVGTLVTGVALLMTPLLPWITATLPGGREVSIDQEMMAQVGGVDSRVPSIAVRVCALLGIAAAIAGLAGVAGAAAASVLAYFGLRVNQAAGKLSSDDGDLIGDLLGRVMPQVGLGRAARPPRITN